MIIDITKCDHQRFIETEVVRYQNDGSFLEEDTIERCADCNKVLKPLGCIWVLTKYGRVPVTVWPDCVYDSVRHPIKE